MEKGNPSRRVRASARLGTTHSPTEIDDPLRFLEPESDGAKRRDRRRPVRLGARLGVHRSKRTWRHLVTAPSHRSCHLLLKATRGVTIALVSSRERKRRQPGLATDDPAFVGWHQLVRGIQRSQVHFDLVCGARENGRAAAGTEKPPGVVACFAIDRHRILREHRGSVKKGPMMLAAVETVTKADPVGAPTPQFGRCRKGNRP